MRVRQGVSGAASARCHGTITEDGLELGNVLLSGGMMGSLFNRGYSHGGPSQMTRPLMMNPSKALHKSALHR